MSPITFSLQGPISKIMILSVVKDLEKFSNNLEVNFNDQAPEESLLKLNESIESMKTIISERFPSINQNEFINFLISSPIKSDRLDFNNLIETFKLFNLLDESPTHKVDHSEIEVSITVSEPSASEIVNKESYFNLFITIVFPILTFLISQYQVAETTEQLNRMENLIEQHIEQLNEQQKVEKGNPYIIEIQSDISPGTRT